MLRGTYPRVPVDCHCVCDTGEWVNFLIAGRIKDYLVLMCKGRNITTLGCYKHLFNFCQLQKPFNFLSQDV